MDAIGIKFQFMLPPYRLKTDGSCDATGKKAAISRLFVEVRESQAALLTTARGIFA